MTSYADTGGLSWY